MWVNSSEFIRVKTQRCTDALNEFSFDDSDWDLYEHPHSGYIPEYETREREYVTEDMIAALFQEFKVDIEACFSRSESAQALLFLPAIYDACMKKSKTRTRFCTTTSTIC